MGKGVYERIGELVNKGSRFVFCRVITAKGSTPRSSGAVMAVLDNGETIGSVGGGKIEYDCILKAREMLDGMSACENTEKPFSDKGPGEPLERQEILHFELYPENSGEEYICGGEMDIVIKLVTAEDTGTHGEILELVREHRRRKVYIFGGGHVAQALVPVLAKIEFAPVIYEEREEFASQEIFPEAEDVICRGFEGLGEILKLGKSDFCAIMTRGHADDYTVLKQILSTDVEYIGLMGSRKKRAILVEKLIRDGFDENDISRIHNPIGLDIGSETPEEIAISIAAEMIAVRAAGGPENKDE